MRNAWKSRVMWRNGLLCSAILLCPVAWLMPTTYSAEQLVALGDFGTEVDARPDGFADRLLWDDARSCLVVHYLGLDGLDRDDRSGEVVSIEIIETGQGYGRAMPGTNGLRVRTISVDALLESFRREHLGEVDTDDSDQLAEVELWSIPLQVDDAGTEGTGLEAIAVLDGRAGAWSYYPLDYPWENPLLKADDFRLTTDDNDLQIVFGGSGYHLPPSLLPASQARLEVRLEGDIGSLGFVPGGALTVTRYVPGSDEPITDTIDRFEITGDILNPLAQTPGNWRNLLAHTPATGDASLAWTLPWAATQPGQIADLLIVADGMGQEAYLADDQSLQVGEETDSEDIAVGVLDGTDDLVRNPVGTDLSTIELTGDDPLLDVTGAEIESVDTGASAGDANDMMNTEPTSGIGYEPGIFEVRDADGSIVTGWVIRYETDSEGRVYVNAKGSAKRIAGNVTRERVGIPGARVHEHGWVIERNPAAIIDATGWTVHPCGNGTGFTCEGIRLHGQLVALPPISNRTDSPDGYDVGLAPQVVIERIDDRAAATVAKVSPVFQMRQPAQGRVVGAVIKSPGSDYYRTPVLKTAEDATGIGVVAVPSLGGDGRLPITHEGQVAEVTFEDWQVYTNGDFNGDGINDLFLHQPRTGESAIWNLGDGASILSRRGKAQSHAMPTLSPSWQVGGIGRFGLDQPGCCILWRDDLTGQNAVWIVNSSSPNPAKWIQAGSDFLPSVIDLGWSMACTNNAARTVGDRLFWMDPSVGSVAQWKIKVDPARPGDEWVEEPDYIRDPQGERIVGMQSSWELVGAGSLGGQPRSDGSDAFRDLLFFDHETGRAAIWLLDASGSQIDGSAPNGGAGFVTRSGAVIAGDTRYCKPVGIGQYALDNVSWSRLGDDQARTQWFPTIGWSLPGNGPWFTWLLDRGVDPVHTSKGSLEGTGMSARPYSVDQLR